MVPMRGEHDLSVYLFVEMRLIPLAVLDFFPKGQVSGEQIVFQIL